MTALGTLKRKVTRLVEKASGPRIHYDRPPAWNWHLARFVLCSSKHHAFLDRSYIPAMFAVTPRSLRRSMALRLLSLSPHYWIYQFNNCYSPEMSRREILEAEFERNAASRRVIADKVLAQYLRPHMDVLDFGCGPGFLAMEVSRMVHHVTATDVSRGVLACAKHLNHADNIDFVHNETDNLRRVKSESVDLVYSFAVLQHLLKEQATHFLREFARVLKPGGSAVCHTILSEATQHDDPSQGGWLRQRTMLRMVYYTAAEMETLVRDCGFSKVEICAVGDVADVNDDIGREHLLLMKK